MSSDQPTCAGPPGDPSFEDLVRAPGVSAARAAIDGMGERAVRAALLTRVVAARDEHEQRTAPSASVGRRRFLGWMSA